MPHSGTHITIAQVLALTAVDEWNRNSQNTSPDPNVLTAPSADAGPDHWPLGHPNADDTTPEGNRLRYACLGAIGPDVLYLMMDFGADIEDLTDFLVKFGGTFEAIGSNMEKLNRYMSQTESELTHGDTFYLTQSTLALSAIVEKFFLSIVAEYGFNFWANFVPKRESDRPREEWYWADMLHYIKSGDFVQTLWNSASAQTDPLLRAKFRSYALGYMTHYVTDTVGHPYVNQVVQSPFRDYWQRHYLVENFIDSYVWDQWHTSHQQPAPQGPGTPAPTQEEQAPDSTNLIPSSVIGAGAPFNYSRVNDWINIGTVGLDEQIDAVFSQVGDAIKQAADALQNATSQLPSDWNGWAINFSAAPATMDVDLTSEADVKAWAKYVSDAIRATYPKTSTCRVPERLKFLTAAQGGRQVRPDGYPTAEDIAQAYALMRMMMKFSTEAKLQPPMPPVYSDPVAVQAIESQLNQAIQTIMAAASNTPPAPAAGGSVSLDSIFNAVHDAAVYLARLAGATAQAAATLLNQLLTDLANLPANAAQSVLATLNDGIKCVLYHLSVALYGMYQQASQVFMLEGYQTPTTDQLQISFAASGGQQLNTADLWKSPGNLPTGNYPVKESILKFPAPSNSIVTRQRQATPVIYHPTEVPFTASGQRTELPSISLGAAPYPPGTPDVFIHAGIPNAPFPQNDMFNAAGPSMTQFRYFGTALENCHRAMTALVSGSSLLFPNYNLDGDRGYAWPCWEVEPPPSAGAPDGQSKSGYATAVPDPVSPDDTRNNPNLTPLHAQGVSC